VRVYLPLTVQGLTELHRTGRIGPPPLRAHAVTSSLRADPDWSGADDEELEYAALMAAAFASLERIATTGDAPRRVVVAADVDDSAIEPTDDVTEVVVTADIPLARCQAVHVDDADTEGEVAEAVRRLPDATAGDGQALAAVSLSQLELLWFATQEIGDLLG
jgi:hypothetical protein